MNALPALRYLFLVIDHKGYFSSTNTGTFQRPRLLRTARSSKHWRQRPRLRSPPPATFCWARISCICRKFPLQRNTRLLSVQVTKGFLIAASRTKISYNVLKAAIYLRWLAGQRIRLCGLEGVRRNRHRRHSYYEKSGKCRWLLEWFVVDMQFQLKTSITSRPQAPRRAATARETPTMKVRH